MECKQCTSPMEVSVIDSIAYHVCCECGDVVEIQASELDDPISEAISKFEKKHSIQLPKSYKEFLQREDILSLRSAPISIKEKIPSELNYYLENAKYEICGFLGLQIINGSHFLSADYLAQEWETPKGIVLIAGDGHTWVGLDYRSEKSQPSVVFIAGDNWLSVNLLSSFNELIHYVQTDT